jgi:hypothetical protein
LYSTERNIMYTLSYVLPPEGGAKYGKATVLEMESLADTFDTLRNVMADKTGTLPPINLPGSLAYLLTSTDTGTDTYDPVTGYTFRLDHADRLSNACGCCGRLVKFGDHALAGSDDAYCTGCYTWGGKEISCDPANTAHVNPWTATPRDATYMMQIVFESRRSETDTDVRYATRGTHKLWDDVENAMIAWPGLRREQFTEITITRINREIGS